MLQKVQAQLPPLSQSCFQMGPIPGSMLLLSDPLVHSNRCLTLKI